LDQPTFAKHDLISQEFEVFSQRLSEFSKVSKFVLSTTTIKPVYQLFVSDREM
jgi:hypothetical protein